jgi:Coenzyme PQQ synthesis protein D (PqqD)
VILDRRMGQVHRLNSTATCIWAYCDGRHTPAEIAAHVAEAFDQPPHSILNDVVNAIEDLRRLGLLIEHPPMS